MRLLEKRLKSERLLAETARTRRMWRLLSIAALFAACAHPPAPPEPVLQPTETNRTGLGEGDVLEIKVFREPDLGGVYRVSAEGTISFPLIGKVKLRDREADSVAEEIRDRLADGYLKNPEVTVFVREHNSKKVHVLGQVTKSGSFAHEAGMTVIQAVTSAGGFTPLAATNAVRVTRRTGAEDQRFVVKVDDIREGKAPNFLIYPGDIIYVPEALF